MPLLFPGPGVEWVSRTQVPGSQHPLLSAQPPSPPRAAENPGAAGALSLTTDPLRAVPYLTLSCSELQCGVHSAGHSWEGSSAWTPLLGGASAGTGTGARVPGQLKATARIEATRVLGSSPPTPQNRGHLAVSLPWGGKGRGRRAQSQGCREPGHPSSPEGSRVWWGESLQPRHLRPPHAPMAAA